MYVRINTRITSEFFYVVVGEIIPPLKTSHPLSHTTTLQKSPILDPLKLSRFEVSSKKYLQVQTNWWRAEVKRDGKKATEHQETSSRGQAPTLLNQESQTLSMSQWSSLCYDCHKGNSGVRFLFFNLLLCVMLAVPTFAPQHKKIGKQVFLDDSASCWGSHS